MPAGQVTYVKSEHAMASLIKIRAAADAERILATVWAKGMTPMPIPVDPVRIANDLGVKVFDDDLEDEISGAIVNKATSGPVILINRTDAPNRRRFTCAHELGHFVKRSTEKNSEDFEYVDLRGPKASRGYDEDEIYANEFAGCLLMPMPIFDDLYNEGKEVPELSYLFSVSSDAVIIRLKNLGQVD